MSYKPQTILSKSLKEVRVTYKANPEFELNKFKVTCSRDSEYAFRKVWPEDMDVRECCMALFLNRRNNTRGYYLISVGGVAGTVVDAKLIFQAAIAIGASSIVIAHNHPSGNLNPSQADLKLTNRLKEGAEIMDMVILDHLILTEDSYMSFADQGLL